MKELNVYVWWSEGKGDGDGYDETIEVTDEQYQIIKDLELAGEELNEIEDPRIADFCYEKYEELIEELYNRSMEYAENYEEDYREDCLIDPDDEEYDADGEEEQFSMSMKEWWFERYNVGARIDPFLSFDEKD